MARAFVGEVAESCANHVRKAKGVSFNCRHFLFFVERQILEADARAVKIQVDATHLVGKLQKKLRGFVAADVNHFRGNDAGHCGLQSVEASLAPPCNCHLVALRSKQFCHFAADA